MSEREERARRRRIQWTGEMVSPGRPKGCLYRGLPLPERWAALTELCERAWLAAGYTMPPPTPRSEWPVEVFELHSHE